MEIKQEVAKVFSDVEIRCEKLIPIYMCLADTPSPALMDAIFEGDGVCELLGLPLDVEREDDIMQQLQDSDKIGFLAEFATPVPTNITRNGYSSSWGCYQTVWLYADEIEDLHEEAYQWAVDCVELALREHDKEARRGNDTRK